MTRKRFAEKSHQWPRFREELIHRDDQRENPISFLGNQDRHGKRIRRLLENRV